MSTFSLTEESKFVKSYYELLCNDITKVDSLYSEGYKCVITKENNENFKAASVKTSLKSIFKILISSISSVKVDEKNFINVLAQFVYSDKSQQRVSQQFVVSKGLIEREIITFLDEEIVYETHDSRICLINPKKEMHNVVSDISKYVLVESCEQKGGKFVLKINKHNFSYDILRDKIEKEGYKIEKIN